MAIVGQKIILGMNGSSVLLHCSSADADLFLILKISKSPQNSNSSWPS